ncbi:MAG: hypothetical protein R3Y43_08155 [Alphaproteobacteria bacterium]
MKDKNKIFLDYIDDWMTQISSFSNNNLTYQNNLEIAIFKIYVKVEQLVIDYVKHYINNGTDSNNHYLERKMVFDYDELTNFLKKLNKKFLSIDDISDIYQFLFKDKDKFDNLFQDSNMATSLRELKFIRNYIAHESDASKNSYITNVLQNKNFIEPGLFLTQKRNNSTITNFEFYIVNLKNIPSFLD